MDKELAIFKTFNIPFSENCLSDKIVLEDNIENNDIICDILLNPRKNALNTNIKTISKQRVKITIEVSPFATIYLNEPIRIGTINYKELYFKYMVEYRNKMNSYYATILFYKCIK